MLSQLLNSRRQEAFQIYFKQGRFFLDSACTNPLKTDDREILERRLRHYTQWCERQKRSFRFDFIYFEKDSEELDKLWFRDTVVEIQNQHFCFTFQKPAPFSQSSFYKNLSLLDHVKDVVVVSESEPVDEPGPRVIYANPAFTEQTEYQQEEIIGKNPRILQGAETSLEGRRKIREGLRGWKTFRQEIRNYTKSGKPFTVELSISPVADETGWWTHWISFQRNITDEYLLSSSSERLQQIGKIGYWNYNIKSKDLYWSPETYKIHEVPLNTAISEIDAISFYAPHERETIKSHFVNCRQKQKKYDLICDFYDANGKYKKIRTTGEPLIEANGNVNNIFGIIQDITQISEERQELHEIIHNTPAIIYKLNKEGDFTFTNNSWQEYLGHSPDEVVGQNFRQLVHPDDIEMCEQVLTDIVTGKLDRAVVDYRVFNKDGDTRYHRTFGTKHKGEDYIFLGVAFDLTEKREIEFELENILATTQIGVWRWDAIKDQLVWDESVLNMFGISSRIFEGQFSSWIKYIHPDDQERVQHVVDAALKNKNDLQVSFSALTDESELKHLQVRAKIIRNKQRKVTQVNGVCIDKTVEYKLEEERDQQKVKMITQSKLAAIGELAAGVGHEINNPLTIALSYLQKIEVGLSQEKINFSEKIKYSLQRIQKITDGLRQLSYKNKSRDIFCVQTALRETLLFINDIYKNYGIKINFSTDSQKELFIIGDKSELQQVFMNLFSNAKDAIENREEKKINISVEEKGRQVIIKIIDNGEGISKENQDKIFQSFFTTKEIGKGTGLGLALSYQIIKNHDGDLSFTSHQGSGACFQISLPLSPHHPYKSNQQLPAQSLDFTKNLNILIAEDEEEILEIFKDFLQDTNCTLEFAQNGEEAFEKILRNRDGFDLIITDIQMPRLTGTELFERVRKTTEVQHQPKFLFVTGGSFGTDHEPANIKLTHEKILAKPFTAQELVTEIQNLFI